MAGNWSGTSTSNTCIKPFAFGAEACDVLRRSVSCLHASEAAEIQRCYAVTHVRLCTLYAQAQAWGVLSGQHAALVYLSLQFMHTKQKNNQFHHSVDSCHNVLLIQLACAAIIHAKLIGRHVMWGCFEVYDVSCHPGASGSNQLCAYVHSQFYARFMTVVYALAMCRTYLPDDW